ncbi:MAG: serine/threonine-protein kinase [Gemmatimonadales bacterium]
MADTLTRLQAALADRYGIQRELGRGGMATVYLATDLKHDREVAIKVLHPELSATLGPERFDREIKFAAKLQHPNILALYDSGDADGLLYYVMPFVYGESLRDRLNRDGLLPVDFALKVALEVADALGYAHMLGIIHRDIKPENIMLSGGHALVADFGIARALSEAGSNAKLTETGMAIGTPLYMSPEQAVGDTVGPTSDLYSLACVLYEMLAGQPPFGGSNARQIMARHAMEQVPSLQVVRDTVADEVEDAIFAALSKVAADRPQTAAQFAEMLGAPPGMTASRYTASRMTATRRTAARTKVNTPPNAVTVTVGKRSLFTAGVVGSLVLVAMIAAAVWYGRRNGTALDATGSETGLKTSTVAVRYIQDLSSDHKLADVADGLTDALITGLSQVQGLNVISQNGVEPFRDPSISNDSVGRALQAGTIVVGSIEPDGDKVRLNLKLVEGASGAEFGQRSSIEAKATDLLVLRDSVPVRAVELIRKLLGGELQLRNQRQGTKVLAAWSLLQRAQLLHREGEDAADAGDSLTLARTFQTADSLLAVAEPLDPRWPDPIVLRALLDYRRSRLVNDEPSLAKPWITLGLGHIERALVVQPNNPDALELRGNLRYYSYLLELGTGEAGQQALISSAESDFVKATDLNKSQAGAYASLSHLYTRKTSGGSASNAYDVITAANRALEADAFLSNADLIIYRLFSSLYDVSDFPKADQWCREGFRRFPTNPRFTQCQLYLMSIKGAFPDPAVARRLADTLVALTPEDGRAFQRLQANLLVAAVLARASIVESSPQLADSARHLVASSAGNVEVDPPRDLPLDAAFVYTMLGDKALALQQLKIFVAAHPTASATLADPNGWWFKDLQNDPEFRRLVGSGG